MGLTPRGYAYVGLAALLIGFTKTLLARAFAGAVSMVANTAGPVFGI